MKRRWSKKMREAYEKRIRQYDYLIRKGELTKAFKGYGWGPCYICDAAKDSTNNCDLCPFQTFVTPGFCSNPCCADGTYWALEDAIHISSGKVSNCKVVAAARARRAYMIEMGKAVGVLR